MALKQVIDQLNSGSRSTYWADVLDESGRVQGRILLEPIMLCDGPVGGEVAQTSIRFGGGVAGVRQIRTSDLDPERLPNIWYKA